MQWFKKLSSGLQKTSSKLTENISGLVTKRALDQTLLDELGEMLVAADLGVETATDITAQLAKTRFNKQVTLEEVQEAMAEVIAEGLKPVAKELVIDTAQKPFVILVVGVNGNGKTTTIGKLAQQFSKQGKTVMLAACDTFRAAAREQLSLWAKKVGCDMVTGEEGADPASVAYKALEQAKRAATEVLLIDTAGRLQNKMDLMAELEKIIRTLKKQEASAPHATLLVLDATTGQNAHSQVEIFKQTATVTGLIITKLDGTAKGGVVVALAKRFRLPIYAVGVGEGVEDLRPFKPEEFAKGVVGLK